MQHGTMAVSATASRIGLERPRTPSLKAAADRQALYTEFEPLVRRLVRRYAGGRDFHEDLQGEIYCRFCRLLDAYDPARGVPLRPYLVRNLTVSAYTWGRRNWRWQRRETGLLPSMLDTGAERLIGGSEDPTAAWDERLVLNEVRQELASAVRLLPCRQRQALVMRYYESRSFEEIGAELGVRPATVRSLVRHAIANLRRQMGAGDTGALPD